MEWSGVKWSGVKWSGVECDIRKISPPIDPKIWPPMRFHQLFVEPLWGPDFVPFSGPVLGLALFLLGCSLLWERYRRLTCPCFGIGTNHCAFVGMRQVRKAGLPACDRIRQNRPASPPASRPVTKPVSQPASQPARHSASQLAIQPAKKPASQAASRPPTIL